MLLHLTGFGPKRIRTSHDAAGAPSCECELQDNEGSWLPFTDLVFVDPVGTGFSRPTKPEYGAEFYNTLGDIASIAEFIRVYSTRFDTWDAPLFIGGESYGAWRASGVAEALERRGQRVAGVMLISGGIQVGPVIDDELRTALFIPTRTAAAFHHQRLAPDLQKDLKTTLRQVETWARTEYAPALKKIGSLGDAERQAIVGQLSRFTGLDASLIDAQTLIVGRQAFAEQLLRDQKKVLGRFDTRHVEGPPPAGSRRAATVNRYLRETLQFKTDLAYLGIEEAFVPVAAGGQRPPSVGARWNYNQGPQPAPGAPAPPPAPRQNLDAPPGGAQPWLRRAMVINPALTAFVAAGLYDSLNSCAVNDVLVPALEPQFRRQTTAMCYDGGHMMYDEPAVRVQVTRDVATFYQRHAAPRAMTLDSGARLGPYEILEPLGAGGMGEVYRARDGRLGRIVAIKVLRRDLSADPDRIERFEREARSASALNHPNIVTIHDVGVEGSTSYIAMEWVDGASLRELVAAGRPQPVPAVIKIGTQIAEGLAKAHGAGIVHRDLKPDNVMVTRDGLVKILDFGLAKLAPAAADLASQLATQSGGTAAGVLLGTVGYMSPEQATGAAVDHRSDQFALGIILYELATGRRAFSRESAPQTLAAIIEDELERIDTHNPQVPVQLSHVIARCLAKKPDERYESTRDLARDLRDLAHESTGSRIAAAPIRRKSIARLALAAALVALVARRGLLGAAFAWQRGLLRRRQPARRGRPAVQRSHRGSGARLLCAWRDR